MFCLALSGLEEADKVSLKYPVSAITRQDGGAWRRYGDERPDPAQSTAPEQLPDERQLAGRLGDWGTTLPALRLLLPGGQPDRPSIGETIGLSAGLLQDWLTILKRQMILNI